MVSLKIETSPSGDSVQYSGAGYVHRAHPYLQICVEAMVIHAPVRRLASVMGLRLSAKILAASLIACVYLPQSAEASVYRYELEDGTVLFTTEPQRGQQPTAVYGDERRSPASSDTTRDGRPMPSAPDRPNPNPRRAQDAFDDIIQRAATAYNIPFSFIKAVIRAESAFDPHAISHAGAQGLMQLMPRTAESLNCSDPFDPEQNIMAGTQFLRVLSNRYNGDINLVLAAYNAGSGTVARYDGIPYEATRRYIERVFSYYQEYEAELIRAEAAASEEQ